LETLVSRKPLIALFIALGFGLAALPAVASAVQMPWSTVSSGLRTRPATIALSVDGTAYLSQLHWTTWNRSQGRAWGNEWIRSCTPACATGHQYVYRATVHVWNGAGTDTGGGPGGIFQRMTISSHYSYNLFALYDGVWFWDK
jgi:hypothetical protein